MIICHPLKLIFVKTKKTAGTSFEIALSKFCGPDCVVTPISDTDEETRKNRTGRGAQNHVSQKWPDGTTTSHLFFNHMPAADIRRLVPAEIWASYRKVTIVRNPYDAAISRYWWEGGDKSGVDFGRFADLYRVLLSENCVIAPLDGSDEMDNYLRYEHLEDDIKALEIRDLWDEFSSIRAKSGLRPVKGSGVQETFETFPAAADVVADECAETIRRFGYTSPLPAKPRVSSDRTTDRSHVFTLSAGRTGTAWLAQLLGQNLVSGAVHESLLPGDFGTKMPDIRIMREFNNYGMTRRVRDFWRNKLAALPEKYAETNHTLGKCGLIEALARSDHAADTTVVVLRRNLVDQCASYIVRGDFSQITTEWQWYLSPQYRNVMIDPTPFLPRGAVGRSLWYCFEMEARYAYYLKQYGDKIRFVETSLESAATPNGAQDLLKNLGYSGLVNLPEKTNATTSDVSTLEHLKSEVGKVVETMNFNANEIADTYIKGGKKLSLI